MNIFVTVGSTHFNSLIKHIDESIIDVTYQVVCQIADGSYYPKNHQYIEMSDSIEQRFEDADIVITHAGAGTVFHLLETNKKMVVVPNCDRIDDHQLDLANYVKNNDFAEVCYQLEDLKQCIQTVETRQYAHYKNQLFDGYSLIESFLNTSSQKNGNEVASIPINIFQNMEAAVNHIFVSDNDVLHGSAIAINPEKIIRSQNDQATKDAIMSASIRYADGIGVVQTLKRKTGEQVSRIPGCELWEEIMSKAGEYNMPVFILGASPSVNANTVKKLRTDVGVNVCGAQDGFFNQDEEEELIERIAKSSAKVVTVALGSPRQELFIKKCQKKLPNAFYMGVGGTYDVFTEEVKRAPEIYRKLNLEWFYRLMSNPKRIFRQRNLLKYFYLEITRQL